MSKDILQENIRRYRNLNKMTQAALGACLGVSGDAVSSWERGVNEPSLEDMQNMGKIFKVGLEELLTVKYKEIKVTLIEKGEVSMNAIWPKRTGDSVHTVYEIKEARKGVLHRFTNGGGDIMSAIYVANEEIKSVYRERERNLLEDWIKNEAEYL